MGFDPGPEAAKLVLGGLLMMMEFAAAGDDEEGGAGADEMLIKTVRWVMSPCRCFAPREEGALIRVMWLVRMFMQSCELHTDC